MNTPNKPLDPSDASPAEAAADVSDTPKGAIREAVPLVAMALGFASLWAAWLWFGWPYQWIPITATALWALFVVGFTATQWPDCHGRKEKLGLLLVPLLMLPPAAGVAAAGIWSPAGHSSGNSDDSSYEEDYQDNYDPYVDGGVNRGDEPAQCTELDPNNSACTDLMDEFGDQVCDYVEGGGDPEDVGRLLEENGAAPGTGDDIADVGVDTYCPDEGR